MEKEKLLQKINDLRAKANQSETKIRNAARVFERMPLEGTFDEPVLKTFDLEQPDGSIRKVESLGLSTKEGGFVSEAALTRANIVPKLVQIKSGARRGKYMLRMERLNDLSKYGKSQNEQLVGLCGKSFKASQTEIRVYKQKYLESTQAFDNVTVNENEVKNEKEIIDELMKKTEISNGYTFEITD